LFFVDSRCLSANQSLDTLSGSIDRIGVNGRERPLLPYSPQRGKEVLLKRGKGRKRGWRNCTSLGKDREGSPVHALCPDGLAVGVKGEDFIRVKLADIPCRQERNGLLRTPLTDHVPIVEGLGAAVVGSAAQRALDVACGVLIGLPIKDFAVHIVSDGLRFMVSVVVVKLREI